MQRSGRVAPQTDRPTLCRSVAERSHLGSGEELAQTVEDEIDRKGHLDRRALQSLANATRAQNLCDGERHDATEASPALEYWAEPTFRSLTPVRLAHRPIPRRMMRRVQPNTRQYVRRTLGQSYYSEVGTGRIRAAASGTMGASAPTDQRVQKR